MPIVRTYGDIEGMGALALTAGAAQGRAQAASEARARDAQILSSVVPAQQRRRAAEYESDVSRDIAELEQEFAVSDREDQQAFRAQQNLLDRTAETQQEEIGFQRGLIENKQQSKLRLNRERAAEQFKQDQELQKVKQALVMAQPQLKQQPEELDRLTGEYLLQQGRSRSQRQGRTPFEVTGTLDDVGELGYTAYLSGNWDTVKAEQAAFENNMGNDRRAFQGKPSFSSAVQSATTAAMYEDAQRGEFERIERTWRDPTAPQWARETAGAILRQVGQTSRGANARSDQLGGQPGELQRYDTPGAIQQGTAPGMVGGQQYVPSAKSIDEMTSRELDAELERLGQAIRRLEAGQ